MLQKLPFLITIFGIIMGVFIAILFGVNEEMFKEKITDGLSRNVKIQQIVDVAEKEAKIKVEAEKNWRYYQRFHFHSTGIGAMALGLLLLLAFVSAPERLKTAINLAISVGGVLYPFVWLFAGLYGPEMGRDQAKEAFAFFGYMGGVFLLGSIGALVVTARYPLRFAKI